MNFLDKIDEMITQGLYDVFVKNTLLIALAIYCIYFVKMIPTEILELTNNLLVRVAVTVTIIYIGRKHIDLGVMLGLAFYFTIRQANNVNLNIKTNETNEKNQDNKKTLDETNEKQDEVVNQQNQIESGMRIPFHQSKYLNDVMQPAHKTQFTPNFIDEQSMNVMRQEPNSCPMMRNGINESCIQGLQSIQGNIPSGFSDLNNLSQF